MKAKLEELGLGSVQDTTHTILGREGGLFTLSVALLNE